MMGRFSSALALLVVASVALAAKAPTKTIMHPAFSSAGRKEGIEIWRIVSFEPQPVEKKEFGKLYEGDSYIVLHTKEDKSKKGTFTWDIYFWLGSKTSQDESGAAAILSVELDDSLGGGPVQHREVQEHESQQFLSLFKPAGVRYVPGGAASGFHHVDINAPGEKKLYQVKGKKNIRVKQVALDIKSMNKGDCFILDTGREIYVYVGPKSKGTEKIKAASAANQIRDQDHAGRAHVTVIDNSSSQTEVQKFFSELGSGSANQVPNESPTDDDQDFERNLDATVALYKVSDAGGKLVSEKISEKPLKKSMLKSEDCFILDTVTSGIYVWVGKGSTTQEKVKALEQGQNFIASNKYPSWTRLQRVVELAEPSAFREYFSDWSNAQLTSGIGRGSSPPRKGRSIRQCGLAKGFMPDEGNGQSEIWRVEKFKLAPVPPTKYGIFFSGDSYVVKYSYDTPTGRKHVIYYWQGKDSTNDEKAVAALEAVRLDNEVGGKAIQVRVEQGNEPSHFLKIFHGNMIALQGGIKSGFRNVNDSDSYDTDGVRLFQVSGSCEDDIKVIQVPEVTASLNTNDVFLLEIPSKAYLWVGSGCNHAEEAIGQKVKTKMCADKELIVLKEGEEPSDFWEKLGGKGLYTTELEAPATHLQTRLFHCYMNSYGRIKIEEIPNYTQEDMNIDDVMILDAGDAIYVWIGNDASTEEKSNAYELVKTYLKNKKRTENAVITIKQGKEPQHFLNFFETWDDEYWTKQPSLDSLRINEIPDAI
ncbi:gelsolin, cytoplasmic isoform X1 [Halyomorpha halys]|uniref:gelsolin, cytoplasmic isoform X1 n=2 Tax=Halyomorpha halys TaxID=286706 RepID=UPI0006D5150B|nr:gelsolin, cytoplasmic [Halyomorpha halys]